ncbi:MAG: hypothetical protein KIS94_01295 [Chitinophagales bacterium]|nr:hypothetical protein [Chitinophagales bacterium]
MFSLFRDISARFGVLISFVAFSLLIGEFHPFSRFPMFSAFGNRGDYLYLTDEKDEPIFRLYKLKIYSSELTDMMQVREAAYGASDDSLHTATMATEVLQEVIRLNKNNAELEKYGELKLCHRMFYIKEGTVHKEDKILASCSVK